MPPYFAAEYAKSIHCRVCKNLPKINRKFCQEHLTRAILAWRKHRADCKNSGRCLQCPNAPIPGQLRCDSCRKNNQKRCSDWVAKNWLWQSLKNLVLREENNSKGLCSKCPNPQAPGHTLCQRHHELNAIRRNKPSIVSV